MPPMSMKNSMISNVGPDLGLGDSLTQQVQDQLDQEKKRRQLMGLGSQSQVARDLGLAPMGTQPTGSVLGPILGG